MAKGYFLDNIIRLQGIIKINHKVYIGEPPVLNYYILRWEWRGKAINGGASKSGLEYVNDGSPQITKFTPEQVYPRTKVLFGNIIANKLKDLYTDLIEDDISEAK